MKRRPNPYRPKLVALAIRKLVADLNYRIPDANPETGRPWQYAGRWMRYAVLERAQAKAVFHALKGHPHVKPGKTFREVKRPHPKLSWPRAVRPYRYIETP
jgi:hypothetical protein